MAAHDRSFTASEREVLRETRLESIRRSGSGTNTFSVELWVSSELYRKDEVWTSLPDPSKWNHVLLGEPGYGEVAYHTPDKVVHPLDTGELATGRVTGFVVNETLRSATVYTNTPTPVTVDPLWDAYGLEPMFAVQVIVGLIRTNELPGVDARPRLRQLSSLPLVLDPTRAKQLAEGTHPLLSLSVHDTRREDRPALCFTLESKMAPAAESARFRFTLDAQDSARLYLVEMEQPRQPTLTSVRERYAADGWPRLWRSQAVDSSGRLTTTEVSYSEEIDASFEDAEVFAPVFPFEYVISLSSGTGTGQLIHNPRGLKISDSLASPTEKSWLARVGPVLVCVLFIWLPIAVLLRRRVRAFDQLGGQP